eukprot:Skav228384  [mRNA]  locus=scaffold1981:384679:386568:- [translate_table: standard]
MLSGVVLQQLHQILCTNHCMSAAQQAIRRTTGTRHGMACPLGTTMTCFEGDGWMGSLQVLDPCFHCLSRN